MKVLVVDDSAVTRKVLLGALAEEGIVDVIQAADGIEAVEATEKEDFDLILMDWNMPNMSGIEVVREIRARGKTTPVIMVTSEGEKRRVAEAYKAGAAGYIIKPFDPETLYMKIMAVTKTKDAEARPEYDNKSNQDANDKSLLTRHCEEERL